MPCLFPGIHFPGNHFPTFPCLTSIRKIGQRKLNFNQQKKWNIRARKCFPFFILRKTMSFSLLTKSVPCPKKKSLKTLFLSQIIYADQLQASFIFQVIVFSQMSLFILFSSSLFLICCYYYGINLVLRFFPCLYVISLQPCFVSGYKPGISLQPKALMLCKPKPMGRQPIQPQQTKTLGKNQPQQT